MHDALALDADGILGNVDHVPAHPAVGGRKKKSWNPFSSHEDAVAEAEAAHQVPTAPVPARPTGL